jgi:hypothetical protein
MKQVADQDTLKMAINDLAASVDAAIASSSQFTILIITHRKQSRSLDVTLQT